MQVQGIIQLVNLDFTLMQVRDNTKRISLHVLIGFCTIVLLVLAYTTWRQYGLNKQEYIIRAKEDLERMTNNVAANISLQMQVVDQILQRAIEKQHMNLLFGKHLRGSVRHNISLWVNEHDLIDAMVLTNKEGKIDIIYAQDRPHFDVEPGTVFAVSQLFQHHVPDDKAKFFAHVLESKSGSNKPRMIVGRRIEGVDGNFKGVISAVVNTEIISAMFDQLAANSHLSLSLLLDRDRIVLGDDVPQLHLSIVEQAIQDVKQQSSDDSPVLIRDMHLNDQLTLLSFRMLDGFPVVMMLAADERDLLSLWQQQTMTYYALVAMMLLAVIVVVILVAQLAFAHKKQVQFAQKTLAVMHGKSRFFVKASDKLLTPIHAVNGFSQMLFEGYFGQVNKEQKQRLSDITQCSDQVLESVTHIAELVSADVGELALKEEQVDITSVVQGAMRLFAAKFQEQKITLVDNTLQDHVMLQADSARVRHMIVHVLSNAIVYTPSGGTIKVATFFDVSDNFVVEITDSGEGIAKEELRAIIQPFAIEAHAKIKRVSIGLPLCRLYAQLHGGKFDIKSKADHGTKVTFSFPKQRVVEAKKKVFEMGM